MKRAIREHLDAWRRGEGKPWINSNFADLIKTSPPDRHPVGWKRVSDFLVCPEQQQRLIRNIINFTVRPVLPARFFRKINYSPLGCWIWRGSRTTNKYYREHGQAERGRYGEIRIGGGNASKTSPHRLAYVYVVGPIPEGYEIDHRICNNKLCCNPKHLEAVTHAENIRRAHVWRRSRA